MVRVGVNQLRCFGIGQEMHTCIRIPREGSESSNNSFFEFTRAEISQQQID